MLCWVKGPTLDTSYLNTCEKILRLHEVVFGLHDFNFNLGIFFDVLHLSTGICIESFRMRISLSKLLVGH